MDWKTVKYTIKKPMLIGATLADAPKKEMEIIGKIAFPLGRAFQLQDDLLDLFASEERIGEKVLNDLKEGKYTMLVIKALENGDILLLCRRIICELP